MKPWNGRKCWGKGGLRRLAKKTGEDYVWDGWQRREEGWPRKVHLLVLLKAHARHASMLF